MATTERAACACGVQADRSRRAHGNGRAVRANEANEANEANVDPSVKDRTLKRLRRVEGQVRGLQAMVEGDRLCTDVMTQIAAVHEALRGVGREIMRRHLRHCAANANSSARDEADAMYDELVEMMYRSAR